MLAVVRKLGRKISRHPELGWYTILALLVMGPMLMGGYILTLDMVFTPRLPMPTEVSNNYVLQMLLHVLNFGIVGDIIQKLLIFGILLLGAVGAHHLIETESIWPPYVAGVFYTVNPFTYERWMAGQYLILFGYALLPFVARALFKFVAEPRKRTALPLCLWYTALAMVSVHIFVLAVLLGVITFAVYLLAQAPKGKYYRNMWRYGFGVAVGVLLLNSYWLWAVAAGKSPISRTVDAIGSNDLSAFTTASNPDAGLLFNVLSMYGFWAEPFKRFGMPNSRVVAWYVGFAVIALLVVLGMRQMRRRRSLAAVSLGLAGLIGFVVACGVEAPVTGGVTRWLIENVPLMKGFREPQKFSALLVLAYAFFLAYGFARLLSSRRVGRWSQDRREILFQAMLLVIVLYTATMPIGFGRQLKAVHYPDSWYSFNERLEREQGEGKVLFLPWHKYMSFDFAPRVVANPAPDFFYNGRVISGTDAEYGEIKTADADATSRYVDKEILGRLADDQFGERLAKIDVEYVVLSNGYGHKDYAWLAKVPDLKRLSSQPGLTVYRNEAYRG